MATATQLRETVRVPWPHQPGHWTLDTFGSPKTCSGVRPIALLYLAQTVGPSLHLRPVGHFPRGRQTPLPITVHLPCYPDNTELPGNWLGLDPCFYIAYFSWIFFPGETLWHLLSGWVLTPLCNQALVAGAMMNGLPQASRQ